MSKTSFLLLKGMRLQPSVSTAATLSYSAKRQNHYDIAIAGGGLVGTAMACAVGQNTKLSEKKIILLESSKEQNSAKKIGVGDDYSNRVVSINPGNKSFLETLGAWKYISDTRYKVVKKLQVWDACSDALITFNDDLIDDVSYIVENNLILYALQEVCSNYKSNVTVKYESKVKNIQLAGGNKPVALELENGENCTCDLLVS
ncbi:hypothetical protein RUM44_001157 [Polyplax serrata]|uniref:Ubiquinone biosynthesis monooxygenase COQ6 n=1 Tax=Polyplax serrata TaxID=468196 RepID=A0ABR1B6R3_POLSC